MDGDQNRERSGVQSIERAFSILAQIAQQPDGISLSDLSKSVGLHNSTAFHLVRTMVELGVIRQEKSSKRYYLGRTIFSLAASSSREIDLATTATPFLERLVRETGESSHLGLRSGDDVVIAARMAGAGAFQLVERTGGIRPAHATALGKVLLAALPEAQFESWLARAELRAWTSKTITDKDRLRVEIAHVRETRTGFDDAEFDDEVRCLAAAIFDYTGQIAGAIGISGPIWRINLQRMEQITRLVRQVAADLSEELGGNPA